jgi:hypothetical protein
MAHKTTLIGGAGYAEYRVLHRDNCILIFGDVPLSAMTVLTKLAPRNAVVDPIVASMAGANFAFGLRADLDLLKSLLAPSAVARTKQRFPNLQPELVEWLAIGERGMSSEAMFQHLTGARICNERDAKAHPYDTSDVARCRLLLAQCPMLLERFHLMRDLSPEWSRLVDAWPAICTAMDRESPLWREDKGSAPKAYELIQAAIGR